MDESHKTRSIWFGNRSQLIAESMEIRQAPQWFSCRESTCQCRRPGFNPWIRKIPWRRAWQPTPVFLPGESPGQRSLVGYSPWDRKESDLATQQQQWKSTTQQK